MVEQERPLVPEDDQARSLVARIDAASNPSEQETTAWQKELEELQAFAYLDEDVRNQLDDAEVRLKQLRAEAREKAAAQIQPPIEPDPLPKADPVPEKVAPEEDTAGRVDWEHFVASAENFLRPHEARVAALENGSDASLDKDDVEAIRQFNISLETVFDDRMKLPETAHDQTKFTIINTYRGELKDIRNRLAALDRRIEERDRKAAEAAAAKPKSKETIDVNSWDEKDRPRAALDLKKTYEEIDRKSEPPAVYDQTQITDWVTEIEEAIKVLDEDVLGNGALVDKKYENANEVKRTLRKDYLEDRLNPKKLTAKRVLEKLEAKSQELRKAAETAKIDAEKRALESRIEALYLKPGMAPLREIRDELDPTDPEKPLKPIDPTNIVDITDRIQRLVKNLAFLSGMPEADDEFTKPEIRSYFERVKRGANAQLRRLQEAFIKYQIDAINTVPSPIPEFNNLQLALNSAEAVLGVAPTAAHFDALVAAIEAGGGGPDPREALDTLLTAWRGVTGIKVDEQHFGATSITLSRENVKTYQAQLDALRQRVEPLSTVLNSRLAELVDKVLNPTKPLYKQKYSQIKELSQELAFEEFRASSSGSISRELDRKATLAIQTIKEAYDIIENQDPNRMSWEDLMDEINARNIDISEHGRFKNAGETIRRPMALYSAFHARKGEQPGETRKQAQERIDGVMGVHINNLEDAQHYEGERASGKRAELLNQLANKEGQRVNRSVRRDEVLKAVKYHPVYGEWIRKMLNYMIIEATKVKGAVDANGDLLDENDDPLGESKISYDVQSSSKGGRTILEREVREKFEADMKAALYTTEDAERQKYLIDNIFKLAFKTYYGFSLLDVGFAECQAGTKTKAHDFGTKDDYTLIHRPDAAAVHRSLRYDIMNDWSLNILLKLKEIPEGYGIRDALAPTHHKLEAVQRDLLLINNAYFDVEPFTGVNGIEPSTLFNPWFADPYSFLSIGPGEYLDWGDTVTINLETNPETGEENLVTLDKAQFIAAGYQYNGVKYGPLGDTEMWGTAEAGWQKIITYDMGDLPEVTTKHNIIETLGVADGKPKYGLIDDWRKNGAGLAKIFMPDKLRPFIEPMLTHFIYRIFARCPDTGEARDLIFDEIVMKIRSSIEEKDGLKEYKSELLRVIANISNPDYTPQQVLDIVTNKHHHRDRKYHEVGELMSKNLHPMIYDREKQRRAWLDQQWSKERKTIPTGLRRYVRPNILGPENPEEEEYFLRLRAEKGMELPKVDVERTVNFKKVDKDEDAH